METREILTRFKNGELSMEEAEHYFRKEPFEEMDDYAKLDSHREIRSGFPEVIFCSGKADQHFVHIFKKLYEDNGEDLSQVHTDVWMPLYQILLRYPHKVS